MAANVAWTIPGEMKACSGSSRASSPIKRRPTAMDMRNRVLKENVRPLQRAATMQGGDARVRVGVNTKLPLIPSPAAFSNGRNGIGRATGDWEFL